MGDQVVPDEYGDLLARITADVRTTRLRFARAGSSEVLALYWRIGQLILTRQETEPWATGVIRRLSTDLRRQFPDMKGRRDRAARLATQLAALRQQRDEIAHQVEELVTKHPLSTVLTTMPGAGVRTCARILTEVVGKDVPTAGHLASCAGLWEYPKHRARLGVGQAAGDGPTPMG